MRKRQLRVFLLCFCQVMTLMAIWSSASVDRVFAGQAPSEVIDRCSTAAQLAEEKIVLTLYFPSQDGRCLVPETRTIEKRDQPAARAALEELLVGPKDSTLVKTFESVINIRDVKIQDQTAYIDFSQEIMVAHSGGATGELMTIYSIVNTLTQLPDIHQVVFLVEGKKLETLSGHLDLTTPLQRNDAIIELRVR